MKAPDLPDKYKILKSLGQGGMGAVFKALDKNLDKTVAVKVLASDVAGSDPVAFQRFQQEAKAAGRLKHNNLVEIMDFGITDNNEAYLVMDYVEGKTLKELIQDQDNIPLALVLEIFRQIVAGMNHAHQNNVIHRDLKPANIIISEDEDGSDLVKVIDFGIAKIADAEGAGGDLTRTNAIVGSPLYMCPEQIKGQDIDQRSDIYSLGCILYECLAHYPPFQGDTALDTINMHQFNLAPSINEGREQEPYPEALVELVAKCLEKSPDNRYQTMEEVIRQLEDLIDKLQESSQEDIEQSIPSDRSLDKAQSGSLLKFSAIVIVVLILVGSITYFYLSNLKPIETKVPSPRSAIFNTDSETMVQLKHDLEVLPKDESIEVLSCTVDRKVIDLLRNSGRTRFEFKNVVFKNCADLGLLDQATYLKVGQTNFDDSGAQAISAFTKLKNLGASFTSMSQKGIASLAKIKSLVKLELDGLTNISAADLEPLKSLSNLEKLEVRGVNLNDQGLLKLSGMPNLKKIHISRFSGLTDSGIEKFRRLTSGCIVEADKGIPNDRDEKVQQVLDMFGD